MTGIIENVTANQVRDFQTKQPAFWNDGSPRLQVLVTIDTGIIDPNVEDDDGRRTVYIKGGACSAAHGCRHCTTPV